MVGVRHQVDGCDLGILGGVLAGLMLGHRVLTFGVGALLGVGVGLGGVGVTVTVTVCVIVGAGVYTYWVRSMYGGLTLATSSIPRPVHTTQATTTSQVGPVGFRGTV